VRTLLSELKLQTRAGTPSGSTVRTPPIPPHSGCPPVPIAEWKSLPDGPERSEVVIQNADIVKLARLGLIGPHVMADWLRRRVQPLKMQPHSAWEYSRPSDPSREDPTNFTEKEVSDMLESVFASLDGFLGDCRVVGFSLDHPRMEVCLEHFFLLLWMVSFRVF
jgi:hypothetical protein